MQVTITHSSKIEGVMRKVTYFEVGISVRVSPDEYAVVERFGLGSLRILDRKPPARVRNRAHEPDLWNLKLSDILHVTDTYACETPLEAKTYDAQLREAMPRLKAYIEANMTPLSGSDTFEV